MEVPMDNNEYTRCSDIINEIIEKKTKRLLVANIAAAVFFGVIATAFFVDLNNKMKYKYISMINIIEQIYDVDIEKSVIHRNK